MCELTLTGLGILSAGIRYKSESPRHVVDDAVIATATSVSRNFYWPQIAIIAAQAFPVLHCRQDGNVRSNFLFLVLVLVFLFLFNQS